MVLMAQEEKAERHETMSQTDKDSGWGTDFTYTPKPFQNAIVAEGYALLDRDTLSQFDKIVELSAHPKQEAWNDVIKRQNIQEKDLRQFMNVMEIAGEIADDRENLRGLNAVQIPNNFVKDPQSNLWVREKSPETIGAQVADVFNSQIYRN